MTAQLPPASLIHIGLPKTATTYLQTAWTRDPAICLAMHELGPLVGRARAKGKERSLPPRTLSPPPLSLKTPPQPGQKLLISNEALSNAYINERADVEQLHCFQEYAAALMKRVVPKAKVLIVVRDPSAWIPSIYNQAIKQGGTDSFRQFLRRERDYLEQSLNIRDLFVTWKQQYGSDSVLVLPIELLRDNSQAFFNEIRRFSGIAPPPDMAPAATVNPSLKEGHLDVMRQFNKWVQLLVRHGDHRDRLPQELAAALESIRFATRYAIESPTPELERRLHLLERNMPVQRLHKDMIPKDLLKAIRTKNAKQLKKDKFFGYRDLYT